MQEILTGTQPSKNSNSHGANSVLAKTIGVPAVASIKQQDKISDHEGVMGTGKMQPSSVPYIVMEAGVSLIQCIAATRGRTMAGYTAQFKPLQVRSHTHSIRLQAGFPEPNHHSVGLTALLQVATMSKASYTDLVLSPVFT